MRWRYKNVLWLRLILGLLAVLFAADQGAAQSVSGIVTDVRGSSIAGASVTMVAIDRTERMTTADDGYFRFDSTMGTITVSAAGFRSSIVEVQTSTPMPIAIVLQPAPVSVTVSVTRSEEDMLNASIAVITIESLAVTAARTADDTLRQVPGFQLFRRSSSRTTNPTAQGANLRGVSGSGASRINVLFDGLSLNDAFGGWTYWSRVPMIAVEQIEVFRGGASTFYGSGGLSGAVNIVPLARNDKRVIFKAETSAAERDTADASAVLLASSGKWGLTAAGDTFTTAGYIPVAASSRGTVDAAADSRYANLILKIERGFGDAGRVFVRGNTFGERRRNGTRLTDNRTDFRQLAIGGDLSTRRYGKFGIRAFGEWQTFDQTFTSVSADRSQETLSRSQRVPSRAFGGSVTWRGRTARNEFAASGELLVVRGHSNEIGYSAGVPASITTSGGKATDAALFFQDKFESTAKLTFHLSGRFDLRMNSQGIALSRMLSTGALSQITYADRRDLSLSPRIAVVYDLNESTAFYASYVRAFRAPTLNELYRGFRVGNVVTEANASLKPERSNTIEGGASHTIRRPKVVLRAGVFSTWIDDPIVSVTTSVTGSLITRQRQNVGTTRTRGFEADVEFSPMPRLKLNAGYQAVGPKITKFPADASLVGKVLPQTARHNFTSQAKYDLNRRLSLSAQVRAASSQFDDDRNTLLLRSYLNADGRISYKVSTSIELFAGVENILNSRYDIGRTPVLTVASPRSVRLGLRVNLSRR